VINADDAHATVWRAAAAAAGARVVTFAADTDADVRAAASLRGDGSTLVLATPAGVARVNLAVPGMHMARNAAAAAAAALAAGVTLLAVEQGLASFRAVAGRLVALRTPGGAFLLDDTYNANPDSMRAAIDVLATLPGTRVLVMGDMGEVGQDGPAFHREIGDYARARGVARLCALGDLAREAVAAFGEGATHFTDAEALAAAVKAQANDGVAVLVKGSRFMRMERIVAALTGTAAGAH
jgi:UDP-N-acetylmuramoyl-tripeptide--D-alanyl-D-alanine ligase